MKICQYLCLHMKIICWRFHIKIVFTFWSIPIWDMWKVYLQTFRNNRIFLKIAYFLRNLQISWVNSLRILRIKNAKIPGYCCNRNTNICRDFQICISVPSIFFSEIKVILKKNQDTLPAPLLSEKLWLTC